MTPEQRSYLEALSDPRAGRAPSLKKDALRAALDRISTLEQKNARLRGDAANANRLLLDAMTLGSFSRDFDAEVSFFRGYDRDSHENPLSEEQRERFTKRMARCARAALSGAPKEGME